MGCSEIEFKGWSCCCMAKSKDTCKCWPTIKIDEPKQPEYPTIHQPPQLKFIQVRKLKLNSD